MNQLNRELALNLLGKDPTSWEFARYIEYNKITIDDKLIASLALQKDGLLLKFCSKELKNDKEVVAIAVTKNGMALDYASEMLKDCDDIVKIAMKLNQAIIFASPRIKKDKTFALISLQYNPNDIRFYSQEIRTICGQATNPSERMLQRRKLEKAIASEKIAQQLNNELSYKNDIKAKMKI